MPDVSPRWSDPATWLDWERHFPAERLPALALDVALAVGVLVGIFVAYLALSRALRAAEASGRLPGSVVWSLRKVLRYVAFLVTAVLLLQVLGVFESVFTALAGVLTLVAAGFVAFWSVLSNLFCALILLAARPFRLGDRITFPAENLGGTVADFNLLFTTLQVAAGRELQVPNNLFFQKMFIRETGDQTADLARSLDAKPAAPLPPGESPTRSE